MKSLLRQSAVGALLLAALLFLVPIHSQGQTASKRKVLDHAAPAYPALARGMALEGVVKVEAIVGADGSVTTVNIKGGHPVLAQAAANAVRHWKWEAASRESHEMVELKFSPEE